MLTLCRTNWRARAEFIPPSGTQESQGHGGRDPSLWSLFASWSKLRAKSGSDFPKNHGHFRENYAALTLFSRNFRDNFFLEKGLKRGKPTALLIHGCKSDLIKPFLELGLHLFIRVRATTTNPVKPGQTGSNQYDKSRSQGQMYAKWLK
jgi:hypothetical protein